MCVGLMQGGGWVSFGVCIQRAWRALHYHQGHWRKWEHYHPVWGTQTQLGWLLFQSSIHNTYSFKTWITVCHHRWCVYLCISRLMLAVHRRAPPPTQYVLSSQGTLVPHGTFWCPCVPVHPSPLHCARQSSTLPVSISLVQLRAGGGKLLTLASFASVGTHWLYLVLYSGCTMKNEQIFRRKLLKLHNFSKSLYLCISIFISVSNPCFLTAL